MRRHMFVVSRRSWASMPSYHLSKRSFITASLPRYSENDNNASSPSSSPAPIRPRSALQRSATAAHKIKDLLERQGPNPYLPDQQNNRRSLGSGQSEGNGGIAGSSGQAPRVISLRSLPRSPIMASGKNMVRNSNGQVVLRNPLAMAANAAASLGASSGSTAGTAAARINRRVRKDHNSDAGGGRRKGGRKARSGGAGRRDGADGNKGDKDKNKNKNSNDIMTRMTALWGAPYTEAEAAYLAQRKAKATRQDTPQPYEPVSDNLSELLEHMPAFPSDASTLGTVGTVRANLRLLASGPVDVRLTSDPRRMAQKLRDDGAMYFDEEDPESVATYRRHLAQGLDGKKGNDELSTQWARAAEKAVRETLWRRAVCGEYEEIEGKSSVAAITSATPVTEALAKKYFLKEATYSKEDTEQFITKFSQLKSRITPAR